MNPLIKKFWNDAGYQVVRGRFPEGNSQRYFWYLEKDGFYGDVVGKSKMVKDLLSNDIVCDIYIYEGKEYSETDMLKII